MNKNMLLRKVWDKIVNSILTDNIIPFPKQTEKCMFCAKQAKWKHSYLNEYTCDDCVPRNCSCTLYKRVKRASFLIRDYDYKRNKTCEDWNKLIK